MIDRRRCRVYTFLVRAKKNEKAWRLLSEKGKIFRSRHGGLDRYILRAGDATKGWKHLFGERGIVECDRELTRNLDSGRGSGTPRDRFCSEADPAMHFVLNLRGECANRSLHLDFIRNDVVPDAAMDAANR